MNEWLTIAVILTVVGGLGAVVTALFVFIPARRESRSSSRVTGSGRVAAGGNVVSSGSVTIRRGSQVIDIKGASQEDMDRLITQLTTRHGGPDEPGHEPDGPDSGPSTPVEEG